MDPGIWLGNNLLDTAECKGLIRKIELKRFSKARFYEKGRHNHESFILEEDLSEKILAKVKVLNLICRSAEFRIKQFSLPIEFYKYETGDYIECHSDASKEIEDGLWSSLT